MTHLRMKVKIQILSLISYITYLKLVLVLRAFSFLNFKVQFATLNTRWLPGVPHLQCKQALKVQLIRPSVYRAYDKKKFESQMKI